MAENLHYSPADQNDWPVVEKIAKILFALSSKIEEHKKIYFFILSETVPS